MTGSFFGALLLVGVFLLLGHAIKALLLRRLIVPPALIGGFLALLLGPELVGGWLARAAPEGWGLGDRLIPAAIGAIWRDMPGYWITVVFAGLFLGTQIPRPREIVNQSLPNLAFGYSLAFGQYVVGVLIAALVLVPVFDINVMAGALIAVGFQGGHGTVAGLSDTFSDLGFAAGTDIGLGIATIGLIAAIGFGTLMSNLGRTGSGDTADVDSEEGLGPEKAPSDKSFGLQFAVLALTIGLAWLALKGLQAAEAALLPEDGFRIFRYVPLFPVAMLMGLVVQLLAERTHLAAQISRQHMESISGLALDLLIVAALGSLSLGTLENNLGPVLILAGAGVLYNVMLYFILAKTLFGDGWRARGLGELGQSMGTTAIGLILLKRGAPESAKFEKPFSYKQPFYEPIVGGGLVTALALPLVNNLGPWVFLGGVVVALLLVGVLYRLLKD